MWMLLRNKEAFTISHYFGLDDKTENPVIAQRWIEVQDSNRRLGILEHSHSVECLADFFSPCLFHLETV